MTPDLIFRILGDRRLKVAVVLLLLAALAQQVSLVVWQLVPMPEAQANQRSPAVVRNQATTESSANFQQQARQIGQAFLFGRPQARKATVEKVEEAPQTALNYKLRGIYFSTDERLAAAIVETRPNNTRHYLLGDELEDKITLAGIEADHILINRYGKLERLDLIKPKDPVGGAVGSAQAADGGSANQVALLRSYKRRYGKNPMALATRFQAIPVQQDGSNIGFKLKALRGESLLKRLNFEPDDVFTAVNGVSLKNPFEALDALKSLTTASQVSVTFLRNGAEQTLDFQI